MNKIEACNVNFYYGDFHALKNISLTVETNEVVAFIGPSGCGKSTFLRLFNRMNDLIPSTRLEGSIKIDGADIYESGSIHRTVRLWKVYVSPAIQPHERFNTLHTLGRLHQNRWR